MDGSNDTGGVAGVGGSVGGGVFSAPEGGVSSGQPGQPITPTPVQPVSYPAADMAGAGRKSRKKWIVIIIGALLMVGLAVFATVLLPEILKGKKVGEAANAGPGEIWLVTGQENSLRYERILPDGGMYEMKEFQPDYAGNTGINFVPLECVRVAISNLEEDRVLCDEKSQNAEEFGGEFFAEMRSALATAFPEVTDLARRLVWRGVYQSAGRVFLNLGWNDDGRVESLVMEYRDGVLSEVLRQSEVIVWVEARAEQ